MSTQTQQSLAPPDQPFRDHRLSMDSTVTNDTTSQHEDAQLEAALAASMSTYQQETGSSRYSRNSSVDGTLSRRKALRASSMNPASTGSADPNLPGVISNSKSWQHTPSASSSTTSQHSSKSTGKGNGQQSAEPSAIPVCMNYSTGHCAPIRSIIVDDHIVYTASDDQTIRVSETSSAQELACISLFLGEILCLAIDKNYLYAGCGLNCVVVIELKTLQVKKILKDHTRKVWAIYTHKESNYLFTGSWDGSVNVYSKTDSFEKLESFQNLGGPVTGLSSSSKYLYISVGHKLIAYSIKSNFQTFYETTAPNKTSTLTSVFVFEKKLIAVGSTDSNIYIYENTGKKKNPLVLRNTLSDHSKTILCFAYRDKTLYSGSLDGAIRLWKTNKKFKCLAIIRGKIPSVWSLCVTKKEIWIGSSDKHLRVVDAESFNRTHFIKGRPAFLTDCISDKFTIFGASSNGNIFIFHKSFAPGFPKALSGHSDVVRSIAIDDKYLYSGSLDKTVRVWDKFKLKPLNILQGHQAPLRRVFVQHNMLFSYDYSGLVAIWRKDPLRLGDRIMKPWEDVRDYSKRPMEQNDWIVLGLTGILLSGYFPVDLNLIKKGQSHLLTDRGIVLPDPNFPQIILVVHPNSFLKNVHLPSSVVKSALKQKEVLKKFHKKHAGK